MFSNCAYAAVLVKVVKTRMIIPRLSRAKIDLRILLIDAAADFFKLFTVLLINMAIYNRWSAIIPISNVEIN